LKRCVLALLLLLPALAPAGAGDHPLLQLARERETSRDPSERGAADGSAVREARHQLEQAHVPADADCAAAIGAARFANLHRELAGAHANAGDMPAAATAYRSAHACRPRDADILAELAGVLFDMRDLRGTREAISASLAIDPRSVSSNRLAGNLDFVEERWADAIARFRYVAASDEDRRQAGYGQLMYWLAQRRGGVPKPEFVTRTPAEGWPQPLLLYMRGEYTEAELVAPIEAGDDSDNELPNTGTDERLCEALYYVGEEYWARGQPEVARDYFAALVNIKVLYFLEHGLALAEIAKLR
jgi:tetratricopeptide (TPR) repeat protein